MKKILCTFTSADKYEIKHADTKKEICTFSLSVQLSNFVKKSNDPHKLSVVGKPTYSSNTHVPN